MKMNVVSYPNTSIDTKSNQILEENAPPSLKKTNGVG